MDWRRIIVALAVVALIVSLLTVLRVHYVRDELNGSLLWNAQEAYLFLGVAEFGYTFSYLGLLREWLMELLPFGASQPNNKHYYMVVLRVTPDNIARYSIDNFWSGSPPSVFGGSIYTGNMLNSRPGPMKWSGTDFESVGLEEQKELQKAIVSGELPATPKYDNVGGWSRRMVGGEVERKSPTGYTEEDAKLTIQLDGKPLTFLMNSGFIGRKAYIDLQRPGYAPERIWYLDEKSRRINAATYKRIFGSV
jgi:hypothetical protein